MTIPELTVDEWHMAGEALAQAAAGNRAVGYLELARKQYTLAQTAAAHAEAPDLWLLMARKVQECTQERTRRASGEQVG